MFVCLVRTVAVILYPIGVFSKAITKVCLQLFGIEASQEPFVSEDELKLVLRYGSAAELHNLLTNKAYPRLLG